MTEDEKWRSEQETSPPSRVSGRKKKRTAWQAQGKVVNELGREANQSSGNKYKYSWGGCRKASRKRQKFTQQGIFGRTR